MLSPVNIDSTKNFLERWIRRDARFDQDKIWLASYQ